MRSIEIIQKELADGFGFLHMRRQEALWRGVEALMRGGRLWLTALGRDMSGNALEKHRIKAVDRLLGNRSIQLGLISMHRVLAAWLLKRSGRPLILVDWTGCGLQQYLLRAGVPFGGRSILLYGVVVPQRLLANRSVHRKFLKTLATILPPHCKPVIVTDAGFYHHWFDQVTKLGWDFIGRVRGRHHVRVRGEQMPLKKLFQLAGRHVMDFGVAELGANRADRYRLVLSPKPKPQGRKRLTRRGSRGRSRTDADFSNGAKDPMLLATSLRCAASAVLAAYKTRMQVEESFRDLKSHRFGFDFSSARSRNPRRLEVLLMIATLASIALSVVGAAAEKCRLHRQFQANTVRSRRVLSLLTLGKRILKNGIELSSQQLSAALAAVQATLAAANPLHSPAG